MEHLLKMLDAASGVSGEAPRYSQDAEGRGAEGRKQGDKLQACWSGVGRSTLFGSPIP